MYDHHFGRTLTYIMDIKTKPKNKHESQVVKNSQANVLVWIHLKKKKLYINMNKKPKQ